MYKDPYGPLSPKQAMAPISLPHFFILTSFVIFIAALSLRPKKREGPDVFNNAVCYGFKLMNKIRLPLFTFSSTMKARLKKGDTDFVK